MLGFFDFEDFLIECCETKKELNETKAPLTYEEILKYLQLMAQRQVIFAEYMEQNQ